MLPEQEFNGDESLFRGEITQALRASKFVMCRGPRDTAQELKNNHAWATEQGQPDKVALVAFPVISRKKCHLLQIILKGNPRPKTGKLRERQRQLVADVLAAFPDQLRPVIYINFTKTGYQTSESFKDMSRALLIAVAKEEDPVANAWMDMYTTPMSDVPRLRLRRMFKFDGSSTHALKDSEFILEMRSRNVIMWPYTPNATALVQELDQLCLWIFKNHAKKIVKLELEFASEAPDLSDPIIKLVWLEDVARAYDADLEQFQPSSALQPSGIHASAHKYECRPDALMILDDLLCRRGTPWGPVRLAKMLGWALGHALLTPSVLEKSFDACTRAFVFSRPLVKRELEFKQRQDLLRAAKLQQLASVGAAVRGSLDFSLTAQIPVSLGAAAVQPIPDDKWAFFRTHVLGTDEQHPGEATMRSLCALFASFSVDYDPVARNTERVEALAQRYIAADDPAVLQANILAEQTAARETKEREFLEWVSKQAAKATTLCTKWDGVITAVVPATNELLVQLGSLRGQGFHLDTASTKKRGAFQKISNSFHRSKKELELAQQEAEIKRNQIEAEMVVQKAKRFSDPALIPDAPEHRAVHTLLIGIVDRLKAAIADITARDTVSNPAPVPAVRARGGSAAAAAAAAAGAAAADDASGELRGRGRGRGGRRGSSRGGRGRAAVAPAAASTNEVQEGSGGQGGAAVASAPAAADGDDVGQDSEDSRDSGAELLMAQIASQLQEEANARAADHAALVAESRNDVFDDSL